MSFRSGTKAKVVRCLTSLLLDSAIFGFFAISESKAGSANVLTDGVTAVHVVPPRALLFGPDSVQQLAVDGDSNDGSRRDLTSVVSFTSSNPEVATVDSAGTITAKSDGSATVTARVGRFDSVVPVEVKGFSTPIPINFGNQGDQGSDFVFGFSSVKGDMKRGRG